MPTRRSHELVVDFLRRGARGRLLDIPAGNGEISAAARELGWQVCELDLFPHPGLRGVLADACAPLPFQDASFDALVCMEGIEHFEDQTGFLRECARVLKPGGRLILTTPNILHLSSRVAGFLTGQRLMQQGFVNEYATLRRSSDGRQHHGHAYLIDLFRLRYLLCAAGLKLDGLRFCGLSPSSAALAPALPLIWAANRWSLSAGRRHQQRRESPVPPREVERELLQLSVSPALLFGKKIVLLARKPAMPAVPRPEPLRAARSSAG
jgi:SAM-dependent methyltransferase